MKKNNLIKKIRNFLKVSKYIFIEPTVEQAKEVCEILYGEEFVISHLLGSTPIIAPVGIRPPESLDKCLSSEQIVLFCASTNSNPSINEHLKECEICRKKVEERVVHMSDMHDVKDHIIDGILSTKGSYADKKDMKHQ